MALGSEPTTYDWSKKGMVKGTDYIKKADLGFLGGAKSKVVKDLPGFKWSKDGMQEGTTYARIADIQALMTPKPAPVPAPTPVEPPKEEPAKPITYVTIESTSDHDQTNVPVTFGQVFCSGDLPKGKGLKDAQIDVKATHPDGSVRHAVVSLIVPKLEKKANLQFDLLPSGVEMPTLVNAVVKPSLELVIQGKRYKPGGYQNNRVWLNGHTALEMGWTVPLVDDNGSAHPHLHARFGSRVYRENIARIEVVIENTWAYENGPQNFEYDVEVRIDGKLLAKDENLTHYHHARSRYVAWIGEEPKVNVRHDIAYLIKSKAVPNYDLSVKVDEKLLAGYEKEWTGAKTKPMGIGLAHFYMPDQGGRRDIGLLPGWAAAYLLSMDPRAKMVTLGTGNLSGSWTMHYRDKETDLPVSLSKYPYMTTKGTPGDTKNPATKKQEAFPKLKDSEKKAVPHTFQTAHHPSLAYVPYLVTGDYYYLEELQFLAAYCAFESNPGYRSNVKGLVYRDEVRAQAWKLRSISEAAYITPDDHPLKAEFNRLVQTNLDWYNEQYTKNPQANKLGVLENGVIYDGKTAVAPWQDDFFTSVVGRLVDFGFTDAQKLLEYKIRFPIERLVGPGVDWRAASHYSYPVRPAEGEPFYTNMGEAYAALDKRSKTKPTTADKDLVKRLAKGGADMGGYSNLATGFPSNMQPALAYAANYGGEAGKAAWEKFEQRDPKPNYGMGPQFAIVPR